MIKNAFAKINEFFEKMEKKRRTRLFVLAAVMVVVIAAASVLLNRKQFTVLYSGMQPQDAGSVMAVLSDMGVDARTQGSDTILVPEEQADKLRMELAAQGYPNSGFNTYDIFQMASGLTATDMEKQYYYQFQLQENIRQTIKKIDIVEDAVVNINLSEESPFVLSENNKPASAAVMLIVKEGQTISVPQVRAIAELVSTSVSGLQLENIRIIDSNMKLYSLEEDDEIEDMGTQIALQQEVQRRLTQQVVSLLKPVFGEDRVVAEVNVKLNFDSMYQESVEFAPPVEGSDEGIAISMKQIAESIRGGATSSVAGIDANGGTSTYPALTDPEATYDHITRETNYEVNQTKTIIEAAKGKIEDLSVSVVLDNTGTEGDYTENVRGLVANAIGVEPERISVESLPFWSMAAADPDLSREAMAAQNDMLQRMQWSSSLRLVILCAAVLLILLILLAIVRTLRPRRVLAGDGMPEDGVDVMADEDIAVPGMDETIDFESRKDGKLHLLETYIDTRPDEVATLLRSWISDTLEDD